MSLIYEDFAKMQTKQFFQQPSKSCKLGFKTKGYKSNSSFKILKLH